MMVVVGGGGERKAKMVIVYDTGDVSTAVARVWQFVGTYY